MMWFVKRLSSLFNLGIRGSGLVFRFLLSFYIIKYLGYEAAGIYGLALGAIGITPALVGWGLNYFVSRDVVGMPKADAAVRLKTRLLVTTISLFGMTVIGLAAALLFGYDVSGTRILILILIWLEVYAVDIHLPLVAMEMPLQANMLVFVRMALWVPFVIGAGLLFPAVQSIASIFLGWIASYVVFFALLLWFLRAWPLKAALEAPIEREWIKRRLRGSWFIYFSDLGMVGLIYIDRYIVTFMLGLAQTGLYTFYWSLTNSLQTLMATAVVQLALPILFKAYNSGSPSSWQQAMRTQIMTTLGFSVFLAMAIFAASEFLIVFLNMPELANHRLVFIMMLIATIIRSCSDLFNIGLTSLHKDKHFASINLASVFLSAAVAFTMISLFGFAGTGAAALLTALIVAVVRGGFLLHFARQRSQGQHSHDSMPITES